ncbi:MAG: AI-2E family transporter [Bacteroidales bacterium]
MKASIRNILIFLGGGLLLACAWYFRNIVVYILVAGVLSIVGRPLVDLLSRIRIKKFSIPVPVSALITLLLLWGVIILFFVIFIPLLTKQISFLSTIDSSKVVQLIEDPLNRIENVFRYLNKDLPQDMSLKQYFAGKVAEVLNINVIQNFLGSVFGVLGNVAVAIFSISFITFFFLKDQHLFFESILMWVPDKYTDNFTRALYSIKNLLTRYFIGIFIQSTCVMILISVGMLIIGIDFQQALVLGLIIGILNIIPYVGPWLGFFIAVTMGVASYINMDFRTVVIPIIYKMSIVVIVTQFIDNWILQPTIFSNSVRAHPLEIFVVVLAVGFAAGIPGMILGIPAYTVIRVFAREFFYNFKAVQKITSGLTPADIGATMTVSNEEEEIVPPPVSEAGDPVQKRKK